MELKAIEAPQVEWRNMYTELLNQLNAAGVNEWYEITGIKSKHDFKVKQINLAGYVRKHKPLGDGYSIHTTGRQSPDGTWALCACKVKVEKKGKRK